MSFAVGSRPLCITISCEGQYGATRGEASDAGLALRCGATCLRTAFGRLSPDSAGFVGRTRSYGCVHDPPGSRDGTKPERQLFASGKAKPKRSSWGPRIGHAS